MGDENLLSYSSDSTISSRESLASEHSCDCGPCDRCFVHWESNSYPKKELRLKLLDSIQKEDLNTIKQLFKDHHNAHPNRWFDMYFRDKTLKIALSNAVRQNNVEIVKFLFTHCKRYDNLKLLLISIRLNSQEMFRLILDNKSFCICSQIVETLSEYPEYFKMLKEYRLRFLKYYDIFINTPLYEPLKKQYNTENCFDNINLNREDCVDLFQYLKHNDYYEKLEYLKRIDPNVYLYYLFKYKDFTDFKRIVEELSLSVSGINEENGQSLLHLTMKNAPSIAIYLLKHKLVQRDLLDHDGKLAIDYVDNDYIKTMMNKQIK